MTPALFGIRRDGICGMYRCCDEDPVLTMGLGSEEFVYCMISDATLMV